MSAAPKTRYATTKDCVSIAYQVFGDGPRDIAIVWGTMSHIELFWDDPPLAHFLERLGSFARVIHFDKRGSGVSDRISGVPTLEERMDDLLAVMDAAGSEKAVIFGESEGGGMVSLFAASYPERTEALILYGSFSRLLAADDYPCGLPAEVVDVFVETAVRSWGEGTMMRLFAPSRPDDDAAIEFGGRFERFSMSPAAMRQLFETNKQIDVRPVLETIRCPTLVLHRSGDLIVNVEHGRYLAEHIPGAKWVELEGADHYLGAGDNDAVVDEIQEFITGDRPVAEPDRVLATVLFTDMVGSTERAAVLGDKAWGDVLNKHDAVVRRETERFGGRWVSSAGDGHLMTFDGPARGVRCACAIRDGLGALGVEVRAGLHTGEIELAGNDVRGIAVHIGSRVSSLAQAGEVLVSRTVTDLVAGSGLSFTEHGEHELKGVPGRWAIYAVSA